MLALPWSGKIIDKVFEYKMDQIKKLSITRTTHLTCLLYPCLHLISDKNKKNKPYSSSIKHVISTANLAFSGIIFTPEKLQ